MYNYFFKEKIEMRTFIETVVVIVGVLLLVYVLGSLYNRTVDINNAIIDLRPDIRQLKSDVFLSTHNIWLNTLTETELQSYINVSRVTDIYCLINTYTSFKFNRKDYSLTNGRLSVAVSLNEVKCSGLDIEGRTISINCKMICEPK